MKSKVVCLLLFVFSVCSSRADDEISLSFGLNVKKGYLSLSVNEGVLADMTGESFDHRTISVTTNAGALPLSADVATAGVAFFKNTSSNHVISIGVTGETPMLLLLAGEIWLGRLAVTNISCVTDAVIYPDYITNISAGVTNIYPPSTNVTASLESIIVEE